MNTVTEVYINYNPYKIETEFRIDGKAVDSNSKIYKFIKGKRLQIWIDEIFSLISSEVNDNNLKVDFYGTIFDFEDIKKTCNSLNYKGDINIEYEYTPCRIKNLDSKIEELKELFKEMQKGPFEELKTDEVKIKFDKAMNSEFEIAVIATMSSGKSTLINGILGRKLLPAKNIACTASITSIKDVDGHDGFDAECYDINNKKICSFKQINSKKMSEINKNKSIFHTKIKGDIPKIASENMHLVIIDTPGPNSSQNQAHKNHTYRLIKNEDKPMVLYVLNATQIGIDDDSKLLSGVANEMKVGGKQTKDRFIFALNKIDNIDPDSEEENISDVIKKAEEYLKDHNIENPNIYPLSAEYANVYRMFKDGYTLTDAQNGTLMKYKLFTKKDMHMTEYVPLSKNLKEKIEEKIRNAEDDKEKALYYSGLPLIEEAINEYIQKYAVTSKIANAVNSFKKILENKKLEEKLRQDMIKDDKIREEYNRTMEALQQKLKKGEEAKKIKEEIDGLIICDTDELKSMLEKVVIVLDVVLEGTKLPDMNNILEDIKLLTLITDMNKIKCEEDMSVREVICHFKKLVENVQSDIMTDIESRIIKNFRKKAQNLLEKYKKYVKGLISVDCDLFNTNDFINIIDLPEPDELISQCLSIETIKVGEELVDNPCYTWWNPFTWYENQDVYTKVTKIDSDKLNEIYFAPLLKNFTNNISNIIGCLEKEDKKLKGFFKKEIDKLDKIVLAKAQELNEVIQDKVTLERKIREDNEKFKWLEDYNNKLNKILEI